MPKRADLRSILIIGSGPIRIGQGCEFDYSASQACRVLRREGLRVVLVNSNPATIMTDPEWADATYIEPLDVETITEVIAAERPDALLPTLGGQTALNLAVELHESGALATPSSLVRDLDPSIERAIQRCLEREPAKRPASALAVSAALRGGDQLAAALAAPRDHGGRDTGHRHDRAARRRHGGRRPSFVRAGVVAADGFGSGAVQSHRRFHDHHAARPGVLPRDGRYGAGVQVACRRLYDQRGRGQPARGVVCRSF